ncbi:hypothetical protein C8R31_10658 [Nitrosospira sp. Nsp2]|uniref:hypothetical protein n=1 Tax=Nitrosospira sp. Nsp2 TaxID=136548 RepID=UPI000D301E50|nr:hypothetical protein [Nitrosospira sp. Nsp2]PTR14386.1 hypothetical protein C8R31_10658 [Nitrosospira sp. Nsp2]
MLRVAPGLMHWLLAAMLLAAGASMAQSFTLPKECAKYGATGSEGDDPVVLVVDNDVNRWLINVPLRLVSPGPPIQWGIIIWPFRNTQAGYSIFATFTPFLTSDAFVADSRSMPSYELILPQPGVTAGRQTMIYDVFPVMIVDSQNAPIPNAFVDFIPDFVGSSPLTLRADGNGVITLLCVQQNFQGYNITVHDSTGKYLYDGSMPGKRSTQTNASAKPAPVLSSPHPGVPK